MEITGLGRESALRHYSVNISGCGALPAGCSQSIARSAGWLASATIARVVTAATEPPITAVVAF